MIAGAELGRITRRDRDGTRRGIVPRIGGGALVRRGLLGFTLIELIVVMGIIAILIGAGVGLIARLRVADRAAVGIVHSTLRSARNWSVAREAPARVFLDADKRTIQAFGMSVIGTWHFEDMPVRGAFGTEGISLGGKIVEDGFTGSALSFAGEPARSRVEIPVHLDPAFDLSRGFSIACAVRPSSSDGGELLAIGESAGISTSDDGAVRAWFAPEIVQEDGERRRGARVVLTTDGGYLCANRWSGIEVQYDRATLRILVDGAAVALLAESSPVWKVESSLVISPTSAAFPGAIDALVVSAVTGEDRRDLPKGVEFGAGTPREIVFAAGGGLDRGVHREPVKFTLKFDDGREEKVLVNLHGTVE
ncbi:MAG: prepilin-type N-terminal cleavage/methylation domain-containing protein [Planctomycetota bacterium]|nr:prepilin-type N-terminal cleavage/methylation domain-containing protein [Planctomycetota bacterium]